VLYRADWHEPLTDRSWDEAWVHGAIAALVDDAVAAYDPDSFWPAQEWDAFGVEPPVQDLFCGAAGVVWALAQLGADFDAAAAATRLHESYRPPGENRLSLFNGETGVALVRWLLQPSDDVRNRVVELIDANLGNPANELMLGVPGTLLAARAVGADTKPSEDALRAARDPDGMWTQRIFGQTFRSYGPIHGLAGNVRVLGEPGRTPEILRDAALRDGEHVNWPPGPDDAKMRLQWCHGAPGIITTVPDLLDDDLVVGGAQLIWDAGPPHASEKGAGLCHGTAGNGYALLTAFARTQDERWLERARAFAVHALEQSQALPPRYSLFTGGVGAALFARDCLDARASFPVLDWF
jgi:lanthionine synthetase-like protein